MFILTHTKNRSTTYHIQKGNFCQLFCILANRQRLPDRQSIVHPPTVLFGSNDEWISTSNISKYHSVMMSDHRPEIWFSIHLHSCVYKPTITTRYRTYLYSCVSSTGPQSIPSTESLSAFIPCPANNTNQRPATHIIIMMEWTVIHTWSTQNEKIVPPPISSFSEHLPQARLLHL